MILTKNDTQFLEKCALGQWGRQACGAKGDFSGLPVSNVCEAGFILVTHSSMPNLASEVRNVPTSSHSPTIPPA